MHSKESAAVTSASPAKRISTRDLALAGMIAAILTIISQISIPMPTGVPITIQVFGIALVSVVFGWRLGLLGTLSYILLGAVGLPIFANFRGGFSVLVDFTGGYIWSWPLMSVLCGLRLNSKQTDGRRPFLPVPLNRACRQRSGRRPPVGISRRGYERRRCFHLFYDCIRTKRYRTHHSGCRPRHPDAQTPYTRRFSDDVIS